MIAAMARKRVLRHGPLDALWYGMLRALRRGGVFAASQRVSCIVFHVTRGRNVTLSSLKGGLRVTAARLGVTDEGRRPRSGSVVAPFAAPRKPELGTAAGGAGVPRRLPSRGRDVTRTRPGRRSGLFATDAAGLAAISTAGRGLRG